MDEILRLGHFHFAERNYVSKAESLRGRAGRMEDVEYRPPESPKQCAKADLLAPRKH